MSLFLSYGLLMLFLTLVSKKFCIFRDGQAIAVVYFRAGYTPNDYPSESVRNILIEFLFPVSCLLLI